MCAGVCETPAVLLGSPSPTDYQGLKSKCALVSSSFQPSFCLGSSLSLARILPSDKGPAIHPTPPPGGRGMKRFPNLQGICVHSELYPGIPWDCEVAQVSSGNTQPWW